MAESVKHVPVVQVQLSNSIAAELIMFEFRLANPDDPDAPIPLEIQYSMSLDLAREVYSRLRVVIDDLQRRSEDLYRRDPS